MNRRKLLQALALAPAAMLAAKYLPCSPADPVMATLDWQPSTAYEIGDIVVINDIRHVVASAGTSGPCEPLPGTSIFERL